MHTDIEMLANAIDEVDAQDERAAEEAKRQAARDAKAAENRAKWQTPSPIFEKLIAAVRGLGRTVNYHGNANELGGWARLEVSGLVDGKTFGAYMVSVDIEEVMQKDGWRWRATGRSKLVIRAVSSTGKRHFPQRQNGEYGYDAAAKAICEFVDEAARKAEHDSRAKSAKQAAADLRERLGVASYTDSVYGSYSTFELKPTANPAKPLNVVLTAWTGECTVEEAEAFIALATAAGIFKAKK